MAKVKQHRVQVWTADGEHNALISYGFTGSPSRLALNLTYRGKSIAHIQFHNRKEACEFIGELVQSLGSRGA